MRGFNLHNTLVIDSDADKVVDCKENSIIIEPYTEEAVLNKVEDKSHDILFKAKDFLL